MATFQGNLQSGDIIYRTGYIPSLPEFKHYGIFINKSEVIHYAPEDTDKSLIISGQDAVIHSVSLNKFLDGNELLIDNNYRPAKFKPEQIIERAMSKVTTNKGRYHLFSHNCEHFVSWCKTGKPQSKQVEFNAAGSVKIAGQGYRYVQVSGNIVTKIGSTVIPVAPKSSARAVSVLHIFADLFLGAFRRREYF